MKAVWRKALADLLGRPWQSLLIVSTLAAAAALLYLGLASLSAAKAPFERQMERTRGAHAWFYFTGGLRGLDLVEMTRSQPEVVETTEAIPYYFTKLVLPETGKASAPVPWVVLTARERSEPMGRILLEGRDLSPGEGTAALLGASVARFHGLKPGDRLTVETPNGNRTITLAGLIVEPRYCEYPDCGSQPLYINPETFKEWTAGSDKTGYFLGVRLTDPAGADRFVARVEKAAGTGGSRGSAFWQVIQNVYQSGLALKMLPVLAFGLVALLAAGLITANIIGGAVLGQYREIGLLKALGFSGGQIRLLFGGQNLLLGLSGGGIGALIGYLISQRTLAPLANTVGTPEVLQFQPLIALAVAAAVTVLASFAALVAAQGAVRGKPAEALARGFAAARGGMPWPVRLLGRFRLPAPVLLGLKDAFARPARAVMTTLSLALCLLTISLSVQITAVGNQVLRDPTIIGLYWDLTVQPQAGKLPETEEAVQQLPGLAGYFRETIRTASAPEQELTFTLRVVDGAWQEAGIRVLSGRLPASTEEIMLSPFLLNRLGVKVGQTLPVQVGDRELPLTVTGTYQDKAEGGNIGLVALETLRRFVPEAAPSVLRVKMEANADRFQARATLMEQAGPRLSIWVESGEFPPWAQDLLDMVAILAAVMTGIAALSVLNTALLTAKEQMHEVGVRKAVGMTPAQIFAAVTTGGLAFAVLAAVIALPLSLVLNQFMVGALASTSGLGSVTVNLPAVVLLELAAGGAAIAVLASWPTALWAGRLPAARVLQAE